MHFEHATERGDLSAQTLLQKTVNASEPDEVEKTIRPFDSELYICNEAYS